MMVCRRETKHTVRMQLLPALPVRQGPLVHLGSTQVLPFVGMPFRLGPKELKSHIHCIGLTGQGKSKLLASYASQLILQGRAVAVVDPHADLAHDVLALLLQAGYFQRKDATKKLLYVDFSNRERALPFNVLRQPYPVDEVARLVMEACSRAWPALADGQAPQFENILLASVPVLIANNLPLTEMTRLLSDRPYRERLLAHVTDLQIVSFFHDRFDQWGREAPLMIESALRRVFLLSYSPALRYALSQQENALNFRQLMDEQTSVIYNLGGLDEQTQKLLGCLVTVGYEVAALSRADLLEEYRTPTHLILDEFASFSAQSEEALARMLSLTRKYGLFCVLAHQTFSQLSSRLAGAMQNTLQIAFRVGREDSVWAAPRFGSFDPLQVKHVVADETAEPRTHPMFLSVQETYEGWAKALESLKPREAFVRVKGKTVKIRTHTIKHNVRWDKIEQLRQSYADALLTPRAEAEKQVNVLSEEYSDGAARTSEPEAVSRIVPLSPAPVPRKGKAIESKAVKRPTKREKVSKRQIHGNEEQQDVAPAVGPLRRSVTTV
jgi:type IV secretory system conjugative DNA transfer VirD4/TraG family protein